MQSQTAAAQAQGILQKIALAEWAASFLTDCLVRGLSSGTVNFYRKKLAAFCDFSDAQQVTRLDQVDANHLRRFFLHLEETGHNPGGRHAHFRTLRTFFNWIEQEEEGFHSPLRKLKPPRVDVQPIQGVSLDEFSALLNACSGNGFTDKRDKALLLALFDTGLRIQECLALTWADVDLVKSTILVRRGKGGKPRTVFFGSETRRALRTYAKMRRDDAPQVWVTHNGRPLTYWGVISLLKRLSKQAGMTKAPSPHDFRRATALQLLRNGADVVSVSRLLGHSGLQVTTRYLAQLESDLQRVHRAHSPVDSLKPRARFRQSKGG